MTTPLANPDVARGWLAALIDGEGCVYWRRVGAHTVRVITITSTDRELIDRALEVCALFGIDCSVSGRDGATPRHRYRWTLDIRRAAAMQRVLDEIPIQHSGKLQRLRESLSFARGLHCAGCGALHGEQTAGCRNCSVRHRLRGY